MYCGEPQMVLSVVSVEKTLLRPKSAIFTQLLGVVSTSSS